MKPGMNPNPGLEVAGEVVAVGAGVSDFIEGDKVCALTNGGGYAQYCAVPASQTLSTPEGMDWVQAAAIPETFFTVWANLFEMGGASKGQRALIHGGTSGIGTTALMLCREFGVKAFATAGSEEKCAVIRQLGAEPINYRDQDFVQVIQEKTANKGVNVILDIMGGSYLNQNIAALSMEGRLVMLGFLGGDHGQTRRGDGFAAALAHPGRKSVDCRTVARIRMASAGGRALPADHRQGIRTHRSVAGPCPNGSGRPHRQDRVARRLIPTQNL
jgi:NADPH:quinone reductase-like Zn-dependent oxidoreductase